MQCQIRALLSLVSSKGLIAHIINHKGGDIKELISFYKNISISIYRLVLYNLFTSKCLKLLQIKPVKYYVYHV